MTLSDIATEANIARTTVYLYFEDKEAIVRQAFQDRIGVVFEAGRLLVATADAPFDEVLRLILSGMYTQLLDPGTLALMKVLIAEGDRMPDLKRYYHDTIMSIAESMMGTLIARGVSSGALRPEARDIDPRLIIAPVIVASVWKMSFDDIQQIDFAQFVDGHLDLVLNGLRAR